MPRAPEGVLVAAIAAISAISGTVVGAVVTYKGNEQLQDRLVHQEEARETMAARAVVRLLISECEADGGRLFFMKTTGEYDSTFYVEHAFVSHIGQEERRLLAGRLSEQHWIVVAEASRQIEAVQTDLEIHHGKGTIGEEERVTFDKADSACQTAYTVLAPLAEGRMAD